MNVIPERIIFVSREITVFNFTNRMYIFTFIQIGIELNDCFVNP